jgi:hypothetical protein
MHQIKNLVVNGCSFTDDRECKTWASEVANSYPDLNYFNLASGAAGNNYILDSTINFLEQQRLDPNNTLVLIMWSGIGRKDMQISGEWWYHLTKDYPVGRKLNDCYYIFSGGMSNSWRDNLTTRKIFDWYYKLSDPETLCQESLMNFLHLENYLQVRNYNYRLTNYVNCWNRGNQSNSNGGDYSIAYFSAKNPVYQNMDFTNWFFVNDQKECLSEFATNMGQLDETGHPTELAHKKFAQQVVNPVLKKLF